LPNLGVAIARHAWRSRSPRPMESCRLDQ